MKNTGYLHYLSYFLISGLLAVGLLNYLADPFSIFQSQRISGFNEKKVDFVKYLRLTKARLITLRKPDALIIGSSRTGYGLSPNHLGFSEHNTFNLGLADVSMTEAVQYLQHAHNIKTLKKVVFALDFRLFYKNNQNSTISKLRLANNGTTNTEYWQAWLNDYFSALFSYDSLKASLRMIRYQKWETNNLLENGMWLRQRIGFDHYQAFRRYNINTIKRTDIPPINNLLSKRAAETLHQYRVFVRYCYQHQIKLYLLFSPSHAWHWETLRDIGAWPAFQYFKQQLTLINEQEAKQFNQRAFPFWDFSGYNHYSTEPAPLLPDSHYYSKWFWETIHYHKQLGDLMLDRIFGLNANNANDYPFGVHLTNTNLASHEAQQTQDHYDYQATHPDDIRIIQKLIKQANHEKKTISRF